MFFAEKCFKWFNSRFIFCNNESLTHLTYLPVKLLSIRVCERSLVLILIKSVLNIQKQPLILLGGSSVGGSCIRCRRCNSGWLFKNYNIKKRRTKVKIVNFYLKTFWSKKNTSKAAQLSLWRLRTSKPVFYIWFRLQYICTFSIISTAPTLSVNSFIAKSVFFYINMKKPLMESGHHQWSVISGGLTLLAWSWWSCDDWAVMEGAPKTAAMNELKAAVFKKTAARWFNLQPQKLWVSWGNEMKHKLKTDRGEESPSCLNW